MGYGKHFEDDFEIAEERHMLHREEVETPPIRLTQTIRSVLRITPIVKAPVVTETVKRQKRKGKQIVCCDCGATFRFGGGERIFFEKNKLTEPKRCPDCRRKRKTENKKGVSK